MEVSETLEDVLLVMLDLTVHSWVRPQLEVITNVMLVSTASRDLQDQSQLMIQLEVSVQAEPIARLELLLHQLVLLNTMDHMLEPRLLLSVTCASQDFTVREEMLRLPLLSAKQSTSVQLVHQDWIIQQLQVTTQKLEKDLKESVREDIICQLHKRMLATSAHLVPSVTKLDLIMLQPAHRDTIVLHTLTSIVLEKCIE